MRVADAGDVFGRGLELHRHHGLGDQLAGLRADDVHTQDLVGAGIGQELDEAGGVAQRPRPAVGQERELPRLPEPEFFLSTHFNETHIEFFDAREKRDLAPWAALTLIAVGYDQRDVRLELIFGEATARYFTTLERFHAHHSPEANGRFATERFIRLIQSLCQQAPKALRNRGTDLLLSGGAGDRIEELVAYPRPSAFIEEITWLLWRARRDSAA
jgi:hypothetical protein